MKAATSRRLKCDAARVEADLRRLLQGEPDVPDRLRRAMAHSLFGGGKRLRPILLAWTHAALRGKGGPPPRSVREAGAALEMLHTYSLIHDDLPAMDDDDLRRGHPTCHVAFDEATAILAGDALQCLAFGILARIPRHGAALAERLAGAAGPAGMVGGQQEDLDSEGGPHSAALIARIHDLKTARLIACALSMGAILSSERPARVERIEAAGQPFDPSEHEAVMQTPSAEHARGVVTAEVEKGYRLNDRVVRAAKVIVSAGAPDETDQPGDDQTTGDGQTAGSQAD